MASPNRINPWDIELPSVSPRSELYSLPPIGIDAGNQESLISFLIRTSRAHSVSPWHLIRHVYGNDPAIEKLSYGRFFKSLSGTINGLGQYSELFVGATERLTGHRGLEALTYLPWKGFFPFNGQGLLVRNPKWCPVCLHHQHLKRRDTYFPLAWSTEPYRICKEHLCDLEEHCPKCNRVQPFLPRYPDMGICDYCRAHLGGSRPRKSYSQLDLWLLDAIENMLTYQIGPDFMPSGELFLAFINEQVETMAGGNKAAFCRAIGINRWGLKNWLNKGERPSFSQFLTLCFGTGTMPSDIFTGSYDFSELHLVQSKVKDRKPNTRLKAADRIQLEKELQTYLEVDECLPVSIIAKQLGYSDQSLRYWFPEQCRIISDHHKDSVKARSELQKAQQCQRVTTIVKVLYESGCYPSINAVNAVLEQEKLSIARPHIINTYKAAIETMYIDSINN